jgi:hypothetical protein
MRSITLLVLLLGAVTAFPQSSTTPEACTAACAADIVCIDSWPDSCICHNAALNQCATDCGLEGDPAGLEDCSVTRRQDCVQTCLSGLVCIQSWPESCYCGNANKETCAAQCGVAASGLQDCAAAKV